MTSHATRRRRPRRAAAPGVHPQAVTAPGPGRARIAVVLAAFALTFSVLQVASYTRKSAVWDEPVHLASGYAALAERDYRVEATHPPFIRMWAALPLLFMDGVRLDTSAIDRMSPSDWHSGSPAYEFATKFLYADNDADRLLDAARFMIVIWAIVLGFLVFSWAYEWLGFWPAVCALAFYTLSPNLLAHGAVVTTDMGITCFMFGTIYFLWRTSRRVSAFNLTLLSVFFALALVTKFSGLILGPIVLALLVLATVRRTAITPRSAAAIVVLLGVSSFVAVWAVCGFQYMPSRSPDWVLHLEDADLARTVPGLARVTAWIDEHRLLPNVITEGFLMFGQAMRPPNATFLAGAYSDEGWWYYFPAAFLMKTPVGFIALLAIGMVVCARRPRQFGWTNELFIGIPVAAYVAAATVTTFQVGLRHILPLYPFFLLIAAAGVSALILRRAGRVVVAGLAVTSAVALISVYPYTLTFFNRVVGGPGNGYRLLADSNIDWGQGLKLLKRWMDQRDISEIGLAYFGTADPAYYGIDYVPLAGSTPGFDRSWLPRPRGRPPLPGYVAVGATVLTGVYQDPHWQLFYRGLRDTAPAAVLGNSMFVYWLDRWPEADDSDGASAPFDVDAHRRLGDELMKQEWPDHAAVHYQRYLDHDPADPAVLADFGLALVWAGDYQDAIQPLRRAVALRPDRGPAHLALAAALYEARQDIGDVVGHARRAVTLMPSDAAAHVMLGRGLAASGRLQEAAESVSRALTLAPNDVDALDLLERIRSVAGLPL